MGKISNFPGGFMLGYDFTNSLVYLSRSNFDKIKNKTIIAFNPRTNVQKELITVSNDIWPQFSPDYTAMYYSLDNKSLLTMDLSTGKTTPYFSIEQAVGEPTSQTASFTFSPDHYLLLINAVDQSQVYKYILDTRTNEIDASLSDPIYKEFYPQYLSPDNKYVLLVTRKQTIKDYDRLDFDNDLSFYSGRYCMWDIEQKKIIPFFNCKRDDDKFIDEKINEDIVIYGWTLHR
ncbi:MAG: hypothetical protein M3Q44_04920 [bacterium]|nr:hypothetical protein [bacterium]